MIKSKLASYLALNRIGGFGPKKISQLIAQLGDITECFKLSATELRNLNLSNQDISQLHTVNWHEVERELAWAQMPQQSIICQDDVTYPPLLKAIISAPPLLFIKGDPSYLNHYCLAMVGSRTPTPGGQDIAYHFSKSLSKAGFCICSGLALGIDGSSHQGAITQIGGTIAVMATGIDHIYPARHSKLAQKIVDHGALISEFPLGTPPKTAHFPRRNRIISGLSLGVLVVEATLRSGSLITARHALEQGREVFAIPGSLHNPLAKGCHELIRQGAKLIDNVEHIVEELGAIANIVTTNLTINKSQQKLEIDYQNLVEFIGYEATSVDLLVKRSGSTVETITSQLLELELLGIIKVVPGGYVRVDFELG